MDIRKKLSLTNKLKYLNILLLFSIFYVILTFVNIIVTIASEGIFNFYSVNALINIIGILSLFYFVEVFSNDNKAITKKIIKVFYKNNEYLIYINKSALKNLQIHICEPKYLYFKSVYTNNTGEKFFKNKEQLEKYTWDTIESYHKMEKEKEKEKQKEELDLKSIEIISDNEKRDMRELKIKKIKNNALYRNIFKKR